MAPKIQDLPLVLDGTGWTWEPAGATSPRTGLRASMWIGTDTHGTAWLVKMRGRVKAARERVFAHLAQTLGISCQSSAFLYLPEDAPPLRDDSGLDRWQLAVGLLELHAPEYCGASCPLVAFDARYRNPRTDKVELLSTCGLGNALDHLRGDLLAYLCGSGELPEKAWTIEHKLVLVDNEEAWASKNGSLRHGSWFHWSTGTVGVATQLCRSLMALPARVIERIVALPDGLECPMSFRERIAGAMEAAKGFLAEIRPTLCMEPCSR